MKKTILSILFVSSLLSNDDLNTTALDMFLFKIGFNSLVGEMENQKNLSNENRKLIKKLQKQIDQFSDIKQNNKISKNFNVINSKNQTINNLESKIILLENKINSLINNKNIKPIIQSNNYKLARLVTNKSNIFSKNNNNSKVLYEITRDKKLKIRGCDEFGWCELYDTQAYIAKYKLKFLN